MGVWTWVTNLWEKAKRGAVRISQRIGRLLRPVWRTVTWPLVQVGNAVAWGYSKLPSWMKSFLNAIGSRLMQFGKSVWNHAESLLVLLASGVGFAAMLQSIPNTLVMPVWFETKLVITAVSAAIVLGLASIAKLRGKSRREAEALRLKLSVERKIRESNRKIMKAIRERQSNKQAVSAGAAVAVA